MRAVGKIMKAARSAPVVASRQYREWVKSLKTKIRRAQAKAAVRVNVELLRLYWEMGCDIAEKRMEAEYGSGFFDNLSRDLKLEFPNMEGFSVSNLKYIKRFYLFYAEKIPYQSGAKSSRTNRHQAGDESSVEIRQQPVDDLENAVESSGRSTSSARRIFMRKTASPICLSTWHTACDRLSGGYASVRGRGRSGS